MNGVRKARWGGPPLALQIMALLVGGLIVAQLVTLLLTVLLPPAPTPQYGLDDIAAALLNAPDADIEGNGLQRKVQAGPPDVSGSGWLVSERSRSELAKLLDVSTARVTLAFYTPLPFAGTAAAPNLAMADDGFAPPFVRPASLITPASFLQVQYVPEPGRTLPVLRGAAQPVHDNLPSGSPSRGITGEPRGGGAPGGAMLPHQDRTHPLITVDPHEVGTALAIPGDGGAAVPLLLRGGGSETTLGQANMAAQGAAGRAQSLAAEIAAARAELENPALDPRFGSGRRPAGAAPFAGGIGQIFPDRALIEPQPLVSGGTSAAPLLVAPLTRGSPKQPSLSRGAAPTDPAPSVGAKPYSTPQPPLILSAPSFDSAPSLQPYEEPAGPPIAITPTRRSLFGLAPAPFVQGDFVAAMKLGNGQWAVVQPAPEPFPNSWQRRVLLWFAIALAVVVPLGWLFARRVVKPIKSFARAAEQLGREPSAAIVPLDGPAEIGGAAYAFNLMQGRLRAFVDDRTAMIGAISHDLRTPLTRMRFRIEDVPDDVRDGLLEEVDEMEAMITQVIEFIRDVSTPGARERLDLQTLVDDVVEDARLVGGDVRVEQAERVPVEIDVLGVRRLLDNLLENAVKYGQRARIRIHADDGEAVAEIIDDGPGLPEDEIERVFEPFYRSDAAVASNTKGSGLGLAVCRSIARAHGGDVRLVQGEDGFRAVVRLPLAFGEAASLSV